MLAMETSMSTRQRPDSHGPLTDSDSSNRASSWAAMKETSLVIRSRTPNVLQVSPVTASSLAGLSSPFDCGLAKIAASASLAFEKAVADYQSETSRSSTPVTDMSSLCTSTTSFATSVQQDTEGAYAYPKEDEQVWCIDKSDKSSSVQGDHEYLNEAQIMAAARSILQSHILRQSQLRYAKSVKSVQSRLSTSDGGDPDHPGYDEDDEDDDGWSGSDHLDSAVIAAVDGNLELAAFLIPLLHRDLRNPVRRKVESWQIASNTTGDPITAAGSTAAGDDDNSGGASGSHAPVSSSGARERSSQTSSQNRKRRCIPHQDSDEDHKGSDDEQRGNDGNGFSRPELPDQVPTPLLACPFHKHEPSRYSIQHHMPDGSRKDIYRACAGPGFKSIQRLKEHLKRKHTPVQCERCYLVFHGSDKARCINELTEHLRSEVPCQRGESGLKEGISEAQWAALDKQNRKKNQEKHKVEKWFEIWHILFPETIEPETPWYDQASLNRAPTPSRENEAFADLFLHILNHKVQQGDISFPGCDMDDIQIRLRNLVQQTFRTYVNLYGPLSLATDASSSLTGTNQIQSSLVGGSSTHQSYLSNVVSLPTTAVSAAATSTHLSPMGGYGMDILPPVSSMGPCGLPYTNPAAQRASGFSPYHHPGAGMSAASATGSLASTYANHSQGDMSMYYSGSMAHWQQPSSMQYAPTASSASAASTAAASMPPANYGQPSQVDYYGQQSAYAPSPSTEHVKRR